MWREYWIACLFNRLCSMSALSTPALPLVPSGKTAWKRPLKLPFGNQTWQFWKFRKKKSSKDFPTFFHAPYSVFFIRFFHEKIVGFSSQVWWPVHHQHQIRRGSPCLLQPSFRIKTPCFALLVLPRVQNGYSILTDKGKNCGFQLIDVPWFSLSSNRHCQAAFSNFRLFPCKLTSSMLIMSGEGG